MPLFVLAWRGLGDVAILPRVLDLAGVSLLLTLAGGLLYLGVGGGLAGLAFRARLHPGWDALVQQGLVNSVLLALLAYLLNFAALMLRSMEAGL